MGCMKQTALVDDLIDYERVWMCVSLGMDGQGRAFISLAGKQARAWDGMGSVYTPVKSMMNGLKSQ